MTSNNHGRREAKGRFSEMVGELVTETSAGKGWQIRSEGMWTYAEPATLGQAQGWKLHLSATLDSAPDVLLSAVPLLVEMGVPFKVASTAQDLIALNSPHCPRQSSGKFVTVYPHDDSQATMLAARLDAATAGLAGPAILSDRRYRDGSLVHYRYGAFQGTSFISNDGKITYGIFRPDGAVVEDRREPRFTPPEWAECPFAVQEAAPHSRQPTAVLLGDRFVVHEAIRHANKGGVFRATDKNSGEDVVVKQARAHVGGDERGVDVGDLLRNEAYVLNELSGTGLTPRLLALFEQDGDTFLAEEALPGVTLRGWTAKSWADGVVVPRRDEIMNVALRVADLLLRVHDTGTILRDLSPNNLMVLPDGAVRLIDLEVAVAIPADGDHHPALDPGRGHITPGYGAPEELAGAQPATTADLFSLGAILCFLFTGEDPYVDPETPQPPNETSPLAVWLAARRRSSLMPPGMDKLVLQLTDRDPSARPSAAAARQTLGRLVATGGSGPTAVQLAEDARQYLNPLAAEVCDLVIRDAILCIAASARHSEARFWPATAFGQTTDPRNVQHGAAGVIGALVQAWRASKDDSILDIVSEAAWWLARRIDDLPSGPVGLYFGSAGQAWSLVDAGKSIDDDALVKHGVELALRLSPEWPGPDVTHGRAGLGLTLLHLAQVVGDPRLLDAANRCADSLFSDAKPDGQDGIMWRTPEDFDSDFAGRAFHGFAHGTAGIGAFLLAMAEATDRDDCLAAALAAANSLTAAIVRRDGSIGWPEGPDGPPTLLPHWCSGASGVGSFLLRLYAYTGNHSLHTLVEGAAHAVLAAKWQSGVAYCHGLAGNGDFLVDAWQILGDDVYHTWAADIASVLFERRVVQAGRVTFGDEPGPRTPDFNVGLGGVLSFFVRLRHGGPRLWTVGHPRSP